MKKPLLAVALVELLDDEDREARRSAAEGLSAQLEGLPEDELRPVLPRLDRHLQNEDDKWILHRLLLAP